MQGAMMPQVAGALNHDGAILLADRQIGIELLA